MGVKKQVICGVALLSCLACAGGTPPVGLEWSAAFSLPPQEDGRAAIGVGDPFFGEHGGHALLAGGSNFPDAPLLTGGRKRFYSDIYALSPGGTNWVRAGQLTRPAAEGMSATTPRGIVCVGGCADGAVVTSRAFLLAWDAARGRAVETALPDFPCGVKLAAAAAEGNRVYVAGGECAHPMTSDVWMLDLDDLRAGWRPLPPLPGAAGRAEAVAFAHNGDQKRKFLYVVGGYAKNADGVLQSLTDGYAYDLAQPADKGRWRPISPAVVRPTTGDQRSGNRPPSPDLRSPTSGAWPLIGARCVTVGDQHALFFGGLDAAYFDENQRRMAELTGGAREAQRIAYQSVTPERNRWNRSVLAYHTVTDRWFVLGEAPFPPVIGGAAVKRADGSVLLASGEIQAGIRTPACAVGRFVQRQRFHPLNWAVMAAYFAGLAGMGWWFMRKKKTADDYFRGGGRIPWWAAGVSIFAAMTSSLSFLAVPALAYISDWQ